jgi:GT2 family glycosyltransferase
MRGDRRGPKSAASTVACVQQTLERASNQFALLPSPRSGMDASTVPMPRELCSEETGFSDPQYAAGPSNATFEIITALVTPKPDCAKPPRKPKSPGVEGQIAAQPKFDRTSAGVLVDEATGLAAKGHRDEAPLAALASQFQLLQDTLRQTERKLAESCMAAQAEREALDRLLRRSHVANVRSAVLAQLGAARKIARRHISGSSLELDFLTSPRACGEDANLTISQIREITGLVDKEWYLVQNPDVAAYPLDPTIHFLTFGMMEGRNPNPLFSSAWYCARNATALQAKLPFLHFIQNRLSARHFHPLFDVDFYLDANAVVLPSSFDALTHFLHHGASAQLNPHPLVWTERLAGQPGFDHSTNPLVDYLTKPELFSASPHPLFDGEFYLSENRDVAGKQVNPLLHYCTIGWQEGRQPCRIFCGDWYLADNPDVLAAKVNPLEHFVRFGASEKRSPHPLFDIEYYLTRYEDARMVSYDPLSHYIMVGSQKRRDTTEIVTVDAMSTIVSRDKWTSHDPISAFVAFGRPSFSQSPDGEARFALMGGSSDWPPSPARDYWLPQKLRDYLLIQHGGGSIGLYLYLMSIISQFAAEPGESFGQSPEFGVLTERLRLSMKRPTTKAELDASIIIPVHNNILYTLTCALSILENQSVFTYEVIIGDDCSTDRTIELSNFPAANLRIVRHKRNLGFLANCNACADLALGSHLVFLNNDTLTLPGWLDALLSPLVGTKGIGLAGSKLLNPDGTLQEAGGILWRDGSAWNFGRNNDPSLPEFNYLKDVDYVSGASIAISRDLWRALDGFDPSYAPAYCEDSDLAFRVRAAGFRTVYIPRSEVIHYEGKSYTHDAVTNKTIHQIANERKFISRWHNTLRSEHFANSENVFLARDRSRLKPHVVFIDHYVPRWDQDAGSRTMYHFLRAFRDAGFHITFWPDNLHEDRAYCRPLQDMGIEVIYSAAHGGRFEQFMSENGKHVQYALVSRPHIAIKYYSALRAGSSCKVLYYGHDIHHKRMERELALKQDFGLIPTIAAMRVQELENWRQADAILYPCIEERDHVRGCQPTAVVEQVPMLGFSADEVSLMRMNMERFEARNFDELLFVGGPHPPNVDALLWFTREVLPLILRRRPKTKLHIVGSMTDDLVKLDTDSIIQWGKVTDGKLAEIYATAGIAIVPLRYGAGVKGKTIEALWNAIPLVSTSVGLQGIFPSEPIAYLADGAEAFSEAVVRSQSCLQETKVRVGRGISFIENHYSMSAMRESFGTLVPELIDKTSEGLLSYPKAAVRRFGPR